MTQDKQTPFCSGNSFVLQPWLLVLWALSGLVNREQQLQIEYLKVEAAILREQLGPRRILLSDDQRRRLAVVGKLLGRSKLFEVGTLFTPDTILRWHRKLIAEKHTYQHRSPGRPAMDDKTVALIVRLANENPTWGCDRIVGELKKLGLRVSDTTVERILRQNGIDTQPKRKDGTSWREFLAAHWECLAAIDFTTVDVWTPSGLKTYYLLFLMELKSRRVNIWAARPTRMKSGCWMQSTLQLTTTDCWVVEFIRRFC